MRPLGLGRDCSSDCPQTRAPSAPHPPFHAGLRHLRATALRIAEEALPNTRECLAAYAARYPEVTIIMETGTHSPWVSRRPPFPAWHAARSLKSAAMNYRTKADYFIRGITEGFVEASEVIAWSDEVVVTAAQTEDWMIEISTCGPADRMAILSHLNTVKGVADPVELAALLKAKGID